MGRCVLFLLVGVALAFHRKPPVASHLYATPYDGLSHTSRHLSKKFVDRRNLVSQHKPTHHFEEDDDATGLTLDQMETGKLFDPTLFEVKKAMAATYHTYLRLRRYLYVAPKRMGYFSDGFRFMGGDNVKRAVKLGIKLAFMGIDLAGAGADAAHDLIHHASTTEDVLSIVSWTISSGEFTAKNIQHAVVVSREQLWWQRGFWVNPLGFDDATFSDIAEAFLNFLAHRDLEGTWNKEAVEETRLAALETGTFRAAAVVESIVNSGITTGISLGYTVVAIILVLIPEPGTSAAGATMLVAGSIYGGVSWGTDALVGNMVKAGKLTHLTSILISYWAFEVNRGCLDETKDIPHQVCPPIRCDIVNKPCPERMICQRNFLFSGAANEGEPDMEFASGDGFCVFYESFATESGSVLLGPEYEAKNIGEHCELHRDCWSGYCHYATPEWDSSNMWQEFHFRHTSSPDSPDSTVPDRLRGIMLDGGVCSKPVRADFNSRGNVCPEGLVWDAISEFHSFSACVPEYLAVAKSRLSFTPPSPSLRTPTAMGDDRFPVFYGDSMVFYALRHTQPSCDGEGCTPPAPRFVPHYWYVYEGWYSNWEASFYPVVRIAPESVLSQSVIQNMDPLLDLNTSPWTVAQQGTFIDVVCAEWAETDCTKFKMVPVESKRFVRYGAYVAIAFEMIEAKVREASIEAGLLDESKKEPAVSHLRLLTTDWNLSRTYPRFVSYVPTPEMEIEPEFVFQMKEIGSERVVFPPNESGPMVTTKVPFALQSVASPELFLCTNNPNNDAEQEFLQPGECIPEQMGLYVKRGYKHNINLELLASRLEF